MLTGIGLRNFKAFGDSPNVLAPNENGEMKLVETAPLSKINLIYGPNSGGKSSIIQALMLLKQSLALPRESDRRELLDKGDIERGDVNLGGFPSLIHKHAVEEELGITIAFDMRFSDGNVRNVEVNMIIIAESPLELDTAMILGGLTQELFQGGNALFKVNMEYIHPSWKTTTQDLHIIGTNFGNDNEVSSTESFLPRWRRKSSREYMPSLLGLDKSVRDSLLKIRSASYSLARYMGRQVMVTTGREVLWRYERELLDLQEDIRSISDAVQKLMTVDHGTPRRETTLRLRQEVSNLIEKRESVRNKGTLGDAFLEALPNRREKIEARKMLDVEEWTSIDQEEPWISIDMGQLKDELAKTFEMLDAEVLKLVQIPRYYEDRLRLLTHLGPVRDDPRRSYEVLGAERNFSGIRGEFTPNILHRSPKVMKVVNDYFKAFDIPYKLDVKSTSDVPETGQNVYIELYDRNTKTSVNITDVGFGISCILPIIVEGVASPEGSIICVEQPELHLHPRLQAKLADLIIETALKDGKQWIVETHSELIARRIQTRIAEGIEVGGSVFSPSDVSALYVDPDPNGSGSKITEMRIKDTGEWAEESWPDGFFDEGYREVMDVVEARLNRIAKQRMSRERQKELLEKRRATDGSN